MSVWIIVLLGVVQGLTEFFPVSSSGHLVIVEALFGSRGPRTSGVIFEVAVHIGTLGAVAVFYRRRLAALLAAVLSLAYPRGGASDGRSEELRFLGHILVGTIPAALAGVLLRDEIADAFGAPALSALFLLVTAVYLLIGRRRCAPRRLSVWTALVIGVAQAVAILPGISRSGWTITTALILGIGFAEAAEFSFLLSIPAILGALALEIARETPAMSAEALVPLALGAVASFAAGWLALKLLIRILTSGTFHRFAYYLIPVGAGFLIYFSR